MSDLNMLHSILSDNTTVSFWPEPFTPEQTRQRIKRANGSYSQNRFGRMGIILKGKGELIDYCGIMISETDGKKENDLGYIIHSSYWNKGYGSEAARVCLEFGFGVPGLLRLTANIDVNNKASVRVAEKIGMKREKEFNNKNNRSLLTYLYSITKTQ